MSLKVAIGDMKSMLIWFVSSFVCSVAVWMLLDPTTFWHRVVVLAICAVIFFASCDLYE